MNINSVLGKDWISKNYSEETVNYLKDNFSLSEILSRLIAIRNIKIEEVQLFLNPRIKNLLPNPFILKDMEKAVDRTIKAIIKKEKSEYLEIMTLMVLLRQLFWEITLTKLIKI